MREHHGNFQSAEFASDHAGYDERTSQVEITRQRINKKTTRGYENLTFNLVETNLVKRSQENH